MINNISNTFCICTEPSVITPDGLTGAKYAEVLKYMCTLQLRHYKTLQKICREPSSDLFLGPFLKEFQASPELLKDCMATGVGCRDKMAMTIKNTVLSFMLSSS